MSCPPFTDGQKQVMRMLIGRSLGSGKEYGLNIFGKDKPRFGKSCSGTECQITLKKAERHVASFHTHPNGWVDASHGDYIAAYHTGELYFCVGGSGDLRGGGFGHPVTRCYNSLHKDYEGLNTPEVKESYMKYVRARVKERDRLSPTLSGNKLVGAVVKNTKYDMVKFANYLKGKVYDAQCDVHHDK